MSLPVYQVGASPLFREWVLPREGDAGLVHLRAELFDFVGRFCEREKHRKSDEAGRKPGEDARCLVPERVMCFVRKSGRSQEPKT